MAMDTSMLDGKNLLKEIPQEVKVWFPIPDAGDINFNARIRPERIKLPTKIINCLCGYVLECLQKISGYSKPFSDGIVVGLSGGIDSATTAALCRAALDKTRYFLKGIILGRGPFGEQGQMNALEYQDVVSAVKMSEDMGIEYQYLDISRIIGSIEELFPGGGEWEKSGVLPRIRSLLLLQIADRMNAICAGSTNGTELILSAFTVGGPGGHFRPLIDFYKSEVYKLSEILGVPGYIRSRRSVISELGIYDEQLYGVGCYVLDPVLRRLSWQKRSPESVAKELGHSVDWLRKIKNVRIEGEKGRKMPPQFTVCRTQKITIKPNLIWDRNSYFDNLLG